ncbi:MAG TPA: DUF6746 family protein [Thiohalobacter sp.]|nr:DUF6746 family protein [Thiohalobacter sp.]
MHKITSTLLLCALSLSQPGLADDRPAHYAGEPAETLEQAVTNLSEYNTRLARILEQSELSSKDLHEIHQITYTLENALERLEEEVEELAEVLEEVHLASENADVGTVRARGSLYLESLRKIIE